ncbi:hypothetical protein KAU34_09870 [candidate division WOR-3 bacterium]|nr:hypothetical protein [candidate division WOR-3 bacterium]
MKRIIISILFIFCFILYSFAEIPIKFYKEETTIKLKENSVIIQGLYFFENRSDFEMLVNMFYPFFINNTNIYPEKIKALDPKNPIDYTKSEKGIEWSLHFEPIGVETVFVEYNQKLKQKSATYILKKFWEEKIDKTSLIIETSLSYKEINFSIEPDSVKTKNDNKIFYITKRYYLPEKNLKITWK